MELPHSLDRTVLIQAAPETVFRFFEDSARWARWWGAGSTIDPRPGGAIYIRHPNGVEVSGEVLEIAPPQRIVFTYGYASGNPIPPGASRVTIRLASEPGGTRLTLRHEFADPAACAQHVQGWRFQLSVFANVVADEWFAGAEEAADVWFEAWTTADPVAFARVAAPCISFRDRYSSLDGMDDLLAHVAAASRFMPGIRLSRLGAVRHCQGVAVADWIATNAAGKEMMAGTSVFVLGFDRKFVSVTSVPKEAK